jgi:hypothetical protein
MSMLGLALTAATLGFAPPQGSGPGDAGPSEESGDAPIVIVNAPAPAPPAPTVSDPSTSAPAVVVVQATPVGPAPGTGPAPLAPRPIPQQPMAGVGLMAAGAGAFLIGVSAQVSTAVSQANFCRNWSGNGFNSVHGCFYLTEPWQVHMGTGFAFGSSLIMTSIGAGALGQRHAWDASYAGGRQRNPRASIIAGGTLLAASVGIAITEGLLLRRELNDFCTTHACEVQRRVMYYTLADVGAGAFIAGVALLSHGHNYRNNLRRYGQDWTLAPAAGPGSLGMSASGRF